jgi:hypothetical protein
MCTTSIINNLCYFTKTVKLKQNQKLHKNELKLQDLIPPIKPYCQKYGIALKG